MSGQQAKAQQGSNRLMDSEQYLQEMAMFTDDKRYQLQPYKANYIL